MRYTFAILLLIAMSYQYVAKVGIIVWYRANTDYITKEYCENKDKPELKCNGQCYLSKQLSKVDKGADTDKESPVVYEKNDLPVYFTTEKPSFYFQLLPEKQKQHSQYSSDYFYTYISSCFHPPNFC
ncbi:MAG: hypothetical protein H6551_00520 [Chitinophagales bacterium]|nr:hypothetical protein [Chitinophagales bacterium]